jgi:hypothetical protein
MIPDMLEATGILPRGLAHPAVFAGADATRASSQDAPPPQEAAGRGPFSLFGGGGNSGGSSSSSSNGSNGNGNGNGQAGFASLLETYGAVPVSAFAMHRLLASGDSVLLYPGGAREAFKRKGEAYQLMWPEKEEFVRMAAKVRAWLLVLVRFPWSKHRARGTSLLGKWWTDAPASAAEGVRPGVMLPCRSERPRPLRLARCECLTRRPSGSTRPGTSYHARARAHK